MVNLTIKPAKQIKSEINMPGDKSISHRAIMLSALAEGETVINNYLASADCLATVECFRKMGIEILRKEDQLTASGKTVIVRGKGLKGLQAPHLTLDVGNSGTTIRLISGILAGQNFISRITGDDSIQRRPMRRVVDPLREMGASIEGRMERNEVYAPLKIQGGDLSAIEYELPVPSAQVKSAVLLAGLFARGETAVIEKVASRDHTERMLAHFGVKIKESGGKVSVCGGGGFEGGEVDVPGDISSAAFFIIAASLLPKSELVIRNVGVNPTRTGIIDILHRMGADLNIMDEEIISEEPRAKIIVKSSKLKGIKMKGEIIPRIIDEIPIIAVAATQAEGITEIRDARELRIKESDRIKTISSELRKMGAKIQELDDGMMIEGPVRLKGSTVESYGDHRVAMALAVAALIAEGETVIQDTACIETSFPGFEKILHKVAA